jgi:UDP-N-acetylmuramyl tripeptide synthase
LFRDQVDRYAEADAVVDRWAAALATASEGTTLVYCADDPRLSMLASGTHLRATTFGAARPPMDREGISDAYGSVADPVACRTCGRQLEYTWRSIGHLGGFACPDGHVRRPEPDITVDLPKMTVPSGGVPEQMAGGTSVAPRRVRIGGRFGEADARPLDDGWTGAYNVAAAVAAGVALGRSTSQGCAAIETSAGPFGRLEWLEIDGRRVILALIKNTVSLAELAYMSPTWTADVVLLGLNDGPADGRDVSWIWDAPIMPLVAGRAVILAGSRRTDLRLRLKYDADVARSPARSIREAATLGDALDLALAQTSRGSAVVVAATYTAMMGLRTIAERRGDASPVPH